MNENPYNIDEDILAAENAVMRRNEGRRLANVMLLKIDSGVPTYTGMWNTNELTCVCEAAAESLNLERIAALERQIAELQAENDGLKYQVKQKDSKTLWNDADDYQSECMRTANSAVDSFGLELSIIGLGLAGETGEVVDHIKKHVGHGHKLDNMKVAKELGDVLWYLAVLSNYMGFKISEVMQMNLEKLRKRYPNGFSVSDSIARVDQKSPGIDSKIALEMHARGEPIKLAGMVDNLVSDLRQELDVEIIKPLDNTDVVSLGPDQWCGYDANGSPAEEIRHPVAPREEQSRENSCPVCRSESCSFAGV